jgi:hypothetical protein
METNDIFENKKENEQIFETLDLRNEDNLTDSPLSPF